MTKSNRLIIQPRRTRPNQPRQPRNNLPSLPNGVILRIDVDALFIPYEVQSFIDNTKTSIRLGAASDTIQLRKIKSPYRILKVYGQKINLNDHPQCRLGTITNDLGDLAVFLVSISSTVNFQAHVLETVRAFSTSKEAVISSQFINVVTSSTINLPDGINNAMATNDPSSHVVSAKAAARVLMKISGKIIATEFNPFFSALQNKTGPVAIVLESFGNKQNATATLDNWPDLNQMLTTSFSDYARSSLKLDLCLSVSFGSGTVTLARPSLFTALDIKPNYVSFFCNSALKLNKKLVSTKTGKRTKLGSRIRAYKLNYYSNTKKMFTLDRSKRVVTPTSSSLLLGALHSLRILRSKPVSREDVINSVLSDFIGRSNLSLPDEYSYRLEMSIDYRDVDRTLSLLRSLVSVQNFMSIPTITFKSIIQQNLSSFTALIAPSSDSVFTLDNLVCSLCAELIMRHVYIDGSSSAPILPSHAFEKFTLAVPFTDTPEVFNIQQAISSVYRSLMVSDRNKIISTMITYAFSSNSPKGLLLQLIPELNYTAATLNEAFAIILKAHVMQMDNAITPAMNRLLAMPDKRIPFSKIAKETLFIEPPASAKIPQLLCVIAMHRFNLSFVHILESFEAYCLGNGIKSLLRMKRTGAQPIRIIFDGQELIDPDKKTLLRSFGIAYANPNSTDYPGEDEIVRLVNGLYYSYYRGDQRYRFRKLYDNFAYGFATTRTTGWIKNRISYINSTYFTERSNYISFIQKVKQWTPLEFTREKRERYIVNVAHQEYMPPHIMELYNKLVEIDVESWMRSSFHTVINNLSGLEILMYVLPENKLSELNCSELRRWDRRMAGEEARMASEAIAASMLVSVGDIANNEGGSEAASEVVIGNEVVSGVVSGAIVTEPIGNEVVTETVITEPVLDNDDYFDIPFDAPVDIPFGDDAPFEFTDLADNSTQHVVRVRRFEDEMINKLFKKYSFKQFTAANSHKNCHSSTQRPPADEWRVYLDSLANLNILKLTVRGKGLLCRFNLPSKYSNSYMDHEFITTFLKRHYSNSSFTAGTSMDKLSGARAPSLDDWKLYLACLVDEGYLEVISGLKDVDKFTLKY